MIRLTSTLALGFCLLSCTPSEAQTSTVVGRVPSADGVMIEYEVLGEGEPALVLIHGWTNPRQIWGQHPRTLSQHNRVVALDLAGHGASGAERESWTMDAFGDDVVAVVEHLDLDPVVLVGFSMGGAVSFEAAEKMPERVLGIVLVDNMQDPDDTMRVNIDQMEAMIRNNLYDPEFIRAFAFTPDAPDSLIEHAMSIIPPEIQEHWFAVLPEMAAWIDSERLTMLERNDRPVAAINTTRQPTDLEAWRRLSPSFSVDTLDGVGHAGILLQRVEEFDERLLEIVERFESEAAMTAD